MIIIMIYDIWYFTSCTMCISKDPQSKLLPRRQSRLQQDHFPIAACRPHQPHKAGVPSSRLTLETGPGKPGGDQGPKTGGQLGAKYPSYQLLGWLKRVKT